MLKREIAKLLADSDTRLGTHETKVARLMEKSHAQLLRLLDARTAS
jgi:hypothetical protein